MGSTEVAYRLAQRYWVVLVQVTIRRVCVCAFTSAHGYGGAPMAGGWRGGRRLLLLLLRLVPAALQRCFQSPLLQGGADGDDKD